MIIFVNVLYSSLVDINGSEMLFSIICFYIEPLVLGIVAGLFLWNKYNLIAILGYLLYLGIGHYMVFETVNSKSFIAIFIGIGIGFVLNMKKNIRYKKETI